MPGPDGPLAKPVLAANRKGASVATVSGYSRGAMADLDSAIQAAMTGGNSNSIDSSSSGGNGSSSGERCEFVIRARAGASGFLQLGVARVTMPAQWLMHGESPTRVSCRGHFAYHGWVGCCERLLTSIWLPQVQATPLQVRPRRTASCRTAPACTARPWTTACVW